MNEIGETERQNRECGIKIFYFLENFDVILRHCWRHIAKQRPQQWRQVAQNGRKHNNLNDGVPANKSTNAKKSKCWIALERIEAVKYLVFTIAASFFLQSATSLSKLCAWVGSSTVSVDSVSDLDLVRRTLIRKVIARATLFTIGRPVTVVSGTTTCLRNITKKKNISL